MRTNLYWYLVRQLTERHIGSHGRKPVVYLDIRVPCHRKFRAGFEFFGTKQKPSILAL